MPQSVPFFFINQIVFAFSVLAILIFVFSKYVLPSVVRTFSARIFINKI